MKLRQRLTLELHRKFRHNNAKLHTLRTLFWECTLRCNVNCRHCGSDCRMEPAKDMPKEDFLRVINEIQPHVDPHKTFIIFTGGEPLLRDDLEEVGRELNRREFPWGMVSNGLLLTESRLRSLIQAGMHSITISLDGFEQEHNWMRQHPQSFQRALSAIQMLVREPRLVWDIVTCVNPRNIARLEEMKEWLISLGVKRWRLFTIVPMGRAATDPELQLDNAQFRQVMDFIKQTRQEGRIHCSYGCEGFLGPYELQVRDHLYYCRAGIEVASVLNDGSISGCTSIRSNFHQGNIYRDSFWEVWEQRFERYRNRQWTRKEGCRDCRLWRYCEGNGMHLYDDDERLRFCHMKRLELL